MTILARMLFLRFQRMTEATGVPEWNFSYPVLDILQDLEMCGGSPSLLMRMVGEPSSSLTSFSQVGWWLTGQNIIVLCLQSYWGSQCISWTEAALGQVGQVGPLQVWTEMLPAPVGVGVTMIIISMIVAIYFNVIMAYCLFYLFNTFRTVLPWTECNPAWADESRAFSEAKQKSGQLKS